MKANKCRLDGAQNGYFLEKQPIMVPTMTRQEAMRLASGQHLRRKLTYLPGRSTPKEGEHPLRKSGELSRSKPGAEPAINIVVSGRETQ